MAVAIRSWMRVREAEARDRSRRVARRRRTRVAAAAATLAVGLFGQTGALAVIADMPTPSGAMSVGRITSQPIGHYEFCRDNPAECRSLGERRRPAALTATRWAALLEVNGAVNNAIAPLTDMELHGRTELWSYPQDAGDCEDYALLKRGLLMDRGFSASDLLITVVRRPNGEGHAVLTVRTDHGDFVLDNLIKDVRDWRSTPYRFLKRQSSTHAGRWVDITGDMAPSMVGSVE